MTYENGKKVAETAKGLKMDYFEISVDSDVSQIIHLFFALFLLHTQVD